MKYSDGYFFSVEGFRNKKENISFQIDNWLYQNFHFREDLLFISSQFHRNNRYQ